MMTFVSKPLYMTEGFYRLRIIYIMSELHFKSVTVLPLVKKKKNYVKYKNNFS